MYACEPSTAQSLITKPSSETRESGTAGPRQTIFSMAQISIDNRPGSRPGHTRKGDRPGKAPQDPRSGPRHGFQLKLGPGPVN